MAFDYKKEYKTDFSKVEFLSYAEGECVQCMHIGSYDDEPATITSMSTAWTGPSAAMNPQY